MEEREEARENEWALMQEPALARAPRHLMRVDGRPCIHKITHLYILLLYMLTIELAINDMALSYSQYLTLLLYLLYKKRKQDVRPQVGGELQLERLERVRAVSEF